MKICVYTTCWGDYWEKYSSNFKNAIECLKQRPDEVMLVSDKKIELPFEIDVPYKNIVIDYPFDGHTLNHYRNVAYKNTQCDWVVSFDIDDVVYPNYASDLDENYDVIPALRDILNVNKELIKVIPPEDQSKLSVVFDNASSYKDLLGVPPAHCAIKREFLERVGGYTPFGWEDCCLNIKIKKYKGSIKWDQPVPRVGYVQIKDSLCHKVDRLYYIKERETESYYKQMFPSSAPVPKSNSLQKIRSKRL